MYPLFLKLENQPCLVVGGGSVAFRKISSLLDANASVTVIAENFIESIESLTNIFLIRGCYKPGMASDYVVIIAATNSSKVNREIYEDAIKASKLINVVDEPELCNFYVPAVINRGKFKLAVCTEGAFPALSKRIRIDLEKQFTDRYRLLIEKLCDYRTNLYRNNIKGRELSDKCRQIAFSSAIDQFIHGDDAALNNELGIP